MAVTYAGFITKFPSFIELSEAQFNLFLPNAIAEVDRYQWQNLGDGWQGWRDRAIEYWLACQFSSTNPEYLGSAGLAEFEIREAGYKVKYLSNSGEQKNNPFCAEYGRLIGIVGGANPSATGLPYGTCGIRKNIVW